MPVTVRTTPTGKAAVVRTKVTVARPVPVWLRIPAIRVSTSVSGLGLNPDRTVEVPTDAEQAGWFQLGPVPGQRGSAVILGHLDSKRGPAVFYRLRDLAPGDRVEVTLANGSTVGFEVNKVATYLKRDFPSRQVYASGDSRSTLNLVTCGGRFDKRTDSYLANVVVYTTLIR